MCFSAGASFTAGVVLTVIGVASIKKTNHKSQLFFASIPFIFGVQQFAEGILWLTIPIGNYFVLQKMATYVYLFFAHILWPLWVPIAILLIEKIRTRKTIQKFLVVTGIIVSLYLAYCLSTYKVSAVIEGHHINYILDYSDLMNNFWIFLYALATIAPPFFSHIKRMWILGFTILVSYLITQIFYENYILSVWCFFSSIISIIVYFFIKDISKNSLQRKPNN
ncbi:DUF6629 family protein [Flavobacterium sp.]|uniref:DUF6629 family protein n=1 Tax=Flavobacterium sp. TaxID=239 RepID=UPI00286C66FE|nr:DUF6629 family protein [Flavobacterium sp.]